MLKRVNKIVIGKKKNSKSEFGQSVSEFVRIDEKNVIREKFEENWCAKRVKKLVTQKNVIIIKKSLSKINCNPENRPEIWK